MPDALPSILLQAPHCALQAGLQQQSRTEQSCSLSAELLRAGLCAHPADEPLTCRDMSRSLQGVKWIIFFNFRVKPSCSARWDPCDSFTNNRKEFPVVAMASRGAECCSPANPHLDFIGSVGLEVVNPSSQGFSGQEGLCCDTSMYSSTKLLLQAPVLTHHETLKLCGLFTSGPQGPSGNSPAFLKPLEQKTSQSQGAPLGQDSIPALGLHYMELQETNQQMEM